VAKSASPRSAATPERRHHGDGEQRRADHPGERCKADRLLRVGAAAPLASVGIKHVIGKKMREAIRGILPFLVILLIVLAIITYVPVLTLWLPGAIFGR
jgi:hypothetical protein